MKRMDVNDYNQISMMVECKFCSSFVGDMCETRIDEYVVECTICHSVRYNDGVMSLLSKYMSKGELDAKQK